MISDCHYILDRSRVHQLVRLWKANEKSIAKTLTDVIWTAPVTRYDCLEIVKLLERTAHLDQEGEPQDVDEDQLPDFWIIEALYE